MLKVGFVDCAVLVGERFSIKVRLKGKKLLEKLSSSFFINFNKVKRFDCISCLYYVVWWLSILCAVSGYDFRGWIIDMKLLLTRYRSF